MVLDCHIHIGARMDEPEIFARKRAEAGVSGGLLFSAYPASFDNRKAQPGEAEARLNQLLRYTEGQKNLYPFFFIDPTEEDALEQVDRAAAAGVAGFKAVCTHYYPQDGRAMEVWTRIARCGKPLLLHSGILYNDGPSAGYNRPGNFEHLFYIDGLRFALAHISWPWVDELIAVYGKWNFLRFGDPSSRVSAEMFIDITPGTPPIYREEALTKLLTVGYPALPGHILFGTDGESCYDSAYAAAIIRRDREIYRKLGVPEEVQDGIFCGNLQKFLGI